MVVMLMGLVVAEQTVKTIEENRYYRNNLPAGTTDYFIIDISPPDRISQIEDFTFNVLGDVKIDGDFQLKIDRIGGQENWRDCKPVEYTNFGADIYRYDMRFDCSNVIDNVFDRGKILQFNVSVQALDKNVRNLDVSYRMTYYNDPKGSMQIFGTEYQAGDPKGKMFLQFLDSEGQAISDSECLLDLYYPNASSHFLEDAVMIHESEPSEDDEGLYYKNFVVPDETGVYMASAKCLTPLDFENIAEVTQTEDFEENSILLNTGLGWSGELDWSDQTTTYIQTVDCFSGDYCLEVTGGYGYADRPFIADGDAVSLNVSFWYKLHLAGADNGVYWIFDGDWHQFASWDANDVQDTWLYFNHVMRADEGYTFGGMLMSFGGGGLQSGVRTMTFDNISIITTYPNVSYTNETEFVRLRGAGEVHVTDNFNNLSVSIDAPSVENIADNVWNYSGNVSTNLLDQFADYFWSWTGTISSTIGSFFSGEVWSHTPDRNLTYYPAQEDLTNYSQIEDLIDNIPEQVDLTNYSQIEDLIDNIDFPEQVDLTNYTQIEDLLDDIDFPNPNNLTASEIWNYGTRDLTYYPTTNISLTNESIQAIGDAVWQYSGTINNNILDQISDSVQCYLNQLLNEGDGEWGIDISAC